MRGSCGRKGRRTACEPAAMIALRKRSDCFLPVGSWPVAPAVSATSSSCGPVNRPTPRTTVTLRIFAIAARPPVSLPTTLALCARSLSRSTVGAPKLTPSDSKWLTSSITAATCSSALDGMQPTLRHTPPSVA